MISHKQNEYEYKVSFTGDELRIAGSMIGNTQSGSATWTIPRDQFASTVGVPPERADELEGLISSLWKEKKDGVPITMSADDLRAIKFMVKRLLRIWGETELKTLTGLEATQVQSFVAELDKNGF
jgi:hypothetical protein